MLPCGISCIKYTLCVFNGLFVLTGIALIVGGACVVHTVQRFKTLLESNILAPPIVLIVVGFAIFVIAFLGCWGAFKEWPIFLTIYAGLLVLVFIIEITVGIIAGMNKDAFFEELLKAMKTSMNNFDPDIPEEKRLWDDLQYHLQCCGVEGPDDWKLGGSLPASCCDGYDPTLHRDHLCVNREFVHEFGCFQELRLQIVASSKVILGIAIGLAVVQLTGIIFACMLSSAIISAKKN